MKKREQLFVMLMVTGSLLFVRNAIGANNVVVVPLGGAVGNATVDDVLKGKTFSSKTAGKGATGTLERHPMGQTYTNSIGMTFNLIPAGTFTMGSPDGTGTEPAEPGRFNHENQHQVTLSKSFYMQITEVTNKQWNTIIVDSAIGVNPSTSTGDTYPVEGVNWYEAVYFANRLSVVEGLSQCYTLNNCGLKAPGTGMTCSSVDITDNCSGYRLPTEAQWEYAARATTTTAYANPVYFDAANKVVEGFNSNLAAMGWYSWNRLGSGYADGTKPVAAKQPNRWGLYDMHGNVYEWCRDWWDGASYATEPATDPTGLATGFYRVVRGGAWSFIARKARSAARLSYPPESKGASIGIRLVLPPAP